MEDMLERKRSKLEETIIGYEKAQDLAWVGWLVVIIGMILLVISTVLGDMMLTAMCIVTVMIGAVLAIMPWYCETKLPSLRRQLKALEMSSQVPQVRRESASLSAIMYCRYCGQGSSPDACFCEKCGKRVD